MTAVLLCSHELQHELAHRALCRMMEHEGFVVPDNVNTKRGEVLVLAQQLAELCYQLLVTDMNRFRPCLSFSVEDDKDFGMVLGEGGDG